MHIATISWQCTLPNTHWLLNISRGMLSMNIRIYSLTSSTLKIHSQHSPFSVHLKHSSWHSSLLFIAFCKEYPFSLSQVIWISPPSRQLNHLIRKDISIMYVCYLQNSHARVTSEWNCHNKYTFFYFVAWKLMHLHYVRNYEVTRYCIKKLMPISTVISTKPTCLNLTTHPCANLEHMKTIPGWEHKTWGDIEDFTHLKKKKKNKTNSSTWVLFKLKHMAGQSH